MSANKVTFGLEQVHVAFKGVAQAESIEILTPCTTDGEITVTITANTLLGAESPASVIVPLAAETHNTVTKVAAAIVTALNYDGIIGTAFKANHSGGVITLASKIVMANDATLDISITTGTTGITAGTSIAVIDGTTGWQKPVYIPGAVNFAPEPQGEESTFYADNGPYFTYSNNNGYTAELSMALIPDNILAQMLGWEIDSNGMLVETTDGEPQEFALMGQVLGDKKNRRFVYYNCKASRPSKQMSTRAESVEPSQDTLTITILPIEINGKKLVKSVIELNDTNQAVYDAFFNAVTLPM